MTSSEEERTCSRCGASGPDVVWVHLETCVECMTDAERELLRRMGGA